MTEKDPHQQREADKYDKPVASRELLLSLIEKIKHPHQRLKAIVKQLQYTDEDMLVGLKHRLRAMENSGQIVFNKFKQYVIADRSDVLTGKVIGHRDGFWLFLPLLMVGKDLYISSYEMKRVIHGDIVGSYFTRSH